MLIGTSPQFSHVFYLNLRASHCERRVRVVKGSADCFPSTAVNDSPSCPWSIAFSNSPHSTTPSQHTMATQSLRSSEFAEAMAAHLFFSLFFSYSVLHCVTRPACSAVFHFFLLKNIKQICDKGKLCFAPSRAKPQLHY